MSAAGGKRTCGILGALAEWEPVQHDAAMFPDELENWSPEDRVELFRAAEYLGGDATNPDRVRLCVDAILNDLEAYDDPDQGLGFWLYASEAPVLNELAQRLNLIVGSLRPIDAGRSAVAHPGWPAAREAAADLARKMRANGKVANEAF
jgi:hypothetical protein